MAEIAPAGGGPNRMFILIALGLAALLIIGILGLGGYLFVSNLARTQLPAPTVRIAAVTDLTSPTAQASDTEAPTETATPTLVVAEAATNTPVLASAQTTSQPTVTPSPTSSSQLPKSGMGDDLLLLSGGFVLVLVILGVRHARLTGKV
ncbi:MAG: hypothetical protein M1132_02945 [Chloroflexi bacterium]|nr:hypothetical protein [Chloroflexota bacterium]MCL5950668.1 hypothetical protein [Chloroflexota bacterium]